MKIGSDTINGHVFAEVSDRLAIIAESALTRGRVILHYTLFIYNNHVYGGIIWQEKD